MLEVTDGLVAERKIDVVVTQASTALMTKDLNITQEVLARLDQKLSAVKLVIDAQ